MGVLLSRKKFYYIALFIFTLLLSFISCKEIVQGPESAEAPLSTVWSLTPPPAVYPYNASGLNITVTNNAVYGEIRYATNGDDPISLGLLYSGSITITGPCTVKLVSITNGVPSEIYSAYYTFKLSPPVFNFPGGLYNETKNITLSSLPAGVTIRYTMDGSDPKTSGTAANYAAAIPISVNTTIRAYGYLAGYVDSDVATHNYVIMPGLFVKTTGNNANLGTPDAPFATITHALSVAAAGTKIYVAAGTYNESITIDNNKTVLGGYNNANWLDVNVKDRDNPTYRTEIVAAAALNYTVLIDNCNNTTRLQGFVIQGGNTGPGRYGVQINTNTPIVQYNTIHGSGPALGFNTHGISINSANPLIQFNVIIGGNGSNSNHGIYIDGATSNPIIQNNAIFASASGASPPSSYGIRILNASAPLKIFNNLIFGGNGNNSYGIYMQNGAAIIYNNTISTGSRLGAANTYGYYGDPSGSTELKNNVIFTDGTAASNYAVYINGAGSTSMDYNTHSPTLSLFNVTIGAGNIQTPVVLDAAKRPTAASDPSIQTGGTNLSGFFTVDLQDNTRTDPWSRGCYEYQ